MRKSILFVLAAASVAAALCPPAAAQVPGMTPSEVATTAKLLEEYWSFDSRTSSVKDLKKLEKAKEKFLEDVKATQAAHKNDDVLAMVDSWQEVFATVANAPKAERPSGAGRIKESSVDQTYNGETIGYEYAFRLPRGYTSKKAWPLIVCLHDEGSDGKSYLKEVWEKGIDAKDTKELADQFILLAPTIGPRTVGKEKAEQKRISWFDRWHLLGMFLPMREILSQFNVDTNRVYLEGTGEGGKTAIHLASVRSKDFAAVAARSAVPHRVEFLGNLLNVPLFLAVRKDGPLQGGQGAEMRKTLDAAKEKLGISVTIDEQEPIPNQNQLRLALGSQNNDPVHEATAAIAKHFQDHARNPYPEALHFTTDTHRFRNLQWIKLGTIDAYESEGEDPARFAHIDAKIDRAKNTIAITSENIPSMQLWLNDRLIDLSKPVKVSINGEDIVEQKVDRSLDFMLDFQRNNPYDASVVWTGVLPVTVPVKVEAVAEDGAGTPDKNGEGGK